MSGQWAVTANAARVDETHPSESMSPRQKTLALLTLIIALVLEIVDMTIVNTALPAIKADLAANAEASQWIVAGYALSFALLLMAGGRMGDSFGYRRMFVIGVAGFTLASLGCGIAMTAEQLVVARLLQGATGAIMAPQFMALLQVLFAPLERVSKLALFGIIGGLASIIGPIIGGILIEADLFGLGWRIVFLINIPIGIAAVLAGRVYLPDTRSSRPSGYDGVGTLLFGLAVAALMWPLMRAEGGWIWLQWLSLAVAAPLAWMGWSHVRARVASHRPALFDPSLFSIKSFRVGLMVAAVFSSASSGFLLVFAFALQAERGQTPLVTGCSVAHAFRLWRDVWHRLSRAQVAAAFWPLGNRGGRIVNGNEQCDPARRNWLAGLGMGGADAFLVPCRNGAGADFGLRPTGDRGAG